MLLLLVIGNTAISSIKGITAAGASDILIQYTPPADAEFLFFDRPKCIDSVPVTPEGNPTPGIITKASRNLLNFPVLVIRSGSIREPRIPYVHITAKEGGDIRKEKGVKDFQEIKEKSEILAELLSSTEDEIMLAESIPGGTTTAMTVLSALGYVAKSSSSFKVNPLKVKESVVKESIKRIHDIKNTDIMEELGDPVLAFISLFSLKFKGKIFLAGGTQMLAVAAYTKEKGKLIDSIITTKYVVNDGSATFKETAGEIGVNYISSEIDLSVSEYEGVRAYEEGVVKEGVGAGGAYHMARLAGYTNDEIVREIDNIYTKMMK